MHHCPRCNKEIKNQEINFCPHCGYDFQKLHKKMEVRFTNQKIKLYMWLYVISFLIATISLVASFMFTKQYLYIIFVMISWYIIIFINRYIGVVDIPKLDDKSKKFLKRVGVVGIVINLMNIVSTINAIISFIKR